MPLFLILMGLALVFLNIKAIKKEKNSFKEMLHTKEADTTETDILIGELRREFSETILELQKEIIELREKVNIQNYSNEDLSAASEDEAVTSEDEISQPVINTDELFVKTDISDNISKEQIEDIPSEEDESGRNNSIRVEEIRKLLSENFSVDEICEKLSIGKGEILLIKEFYLK